LTILIGFGLGAVGIVLQILGGWDYPVVPPGLLITLAAGGVAVVPMRWAPAVSALAGGFLTVGFVLVGDLARLVGDENALVTAGKWGQLVGVVCGLLAALGSLVRPPRLSPSRPAG
jgi:hypothetical protein